jgi:hypothetical protein
MFKNLFILLALVIIIAPHATAVYHYALEHSTITYGVISYLLMSVAMALSDQGTEPVQEP